MAARLPATSRRTARIAGVDGCPAGWAVALARTGRSGWRLDSVEVRSSLDDLVAEVLAGTLDLVAVDMPIGLPFDSRRRTCDVEARRLLGPRRSSVFPAPPRCVLEAPDYAEARRRAVAVTGRSIPVQAWHLVPRIAALDGLLTPALALRVVEAHPELAFARLAGAPLPDPKSTGAGRAQRQALLGVPLPPPPAGAAAADVADAVVLTRTAADVLAGRAWVCGDDVVDDRGLPMRIRG